MSSPIDRLEPFRYETVDFDPLPPGTLRIRGQIAIQEPSKYLQPYVKRVHEAVLAAGLPEFEVDVTGLTFVNSSAIRIFIDWATWLSEGGRPYVLVFRTDTKVMWQRAAFTAIRALAGDAVSVVGGP